MAQGFDLIVGEQKGSFNINNILVDYEVAQNEITKGYYMNLSVAGESIMKGQTLVDGNNLLYNHEWLGLGSRLEFLSYVVDNVEKWSLIYE